MLRPSETPLTLKRLPTLIAATPRPAEATATFLHEAAVHCAHTQCTGRSNTHAQRGQISLEIFVQPQVLPIFYRLDLLET